MSDVLNRRIDDMMRSGEWIDIVAMANEDECRDGLRHQLVQLTRLTTALNLLYPDDVVPGEGSVDRAIRLLEQSRADVIKTIDLCLEHEDYPHGGNHIENDRHARDFEAIVVRYPR